MMQTNLFELNTNTFGTIANTAMFDFVCNDNEPEYTGAAYNRVQVIPKLDG